MPSTDTSATSGRQPWVVGRKTGLSGGASARLVWGRGLWCRDFNVTLESAPPGRTNESRVQTPLRQGKHRQDIGIYRTPTVPSNRRQPYHSVRQSYTCSPRLVPRGRAQSPQRTLNGSARGTRASSTLRASTIRGSSTIRASSSIRGSMSITASSATRGSSSIMNSSPSKRSLNVRTSTPITLGELRRRQGSRGRSKAKSSKTGETRRTLRGGRCVGKDMRGLALLHYAAQSDGGNRPSFAMFTFPAAETPPPIKCPDVVRVLSSLLMLGR